MILNGTICFLHIKMRYLLLLSSRFLNEKVKSLNDQRIKKKKEDRGQENCSFWNCSSFLRRTSSEFFFERETEEREDSKTVGNNETCSDPRNFLFLQCTLETGSISRLQFFLTVNKRSSQEWRRNAVLIISYSPLTLD